MSRVGRLAGSLLAETEGRHYLVGNLKRPCDFAAAGFERPAGDGVGEGGLAPTRGPRAGLPTSGGAEPIQPTLRLQRSGPLAVAGPWLILPLEGEPLLRLLAERLLIPRTGAVSDRLWRLILNLEPEEDLAAAPPDLVLDAAWLAAMPAHIWQLVRDAVLRCT